jgi:hypothetical protein
VVAVYSRPVADQAKANAEVCEFWRMDWHPCDLNLEANWLTCSVLDQLLLSDLLFRGASFLQDGAVNAILYRFPFSLLDSRLALSRSKSPLPHHRDQTPIANPSPLAHVYRAQHPSPLYRSVPMDGTYQQETHPSPVRTDQRGTSTPSSTVPRHPIDPDLLVELLDVSASERM